MRFTEFKQQLSEDWVCGKCYADPCVCESVTNENLRDWFKEKWVRFGPDGKVRGDCARDDDSEGKPKCLPQKKAHALGKKGRKTAASRKRREDPNKNRRGPAKNVKTKESQYVMAEALTEAQFDEAAGEKDACYHKVKARYKVWPSAYASGALSKCRKVGAANWGNKSKKESVEEAYSDTPKSSRDTTSVNPLITIYDDTFKPGRPGIAGHMNLTTMMGIHGISEKYQNKLAQAVINTPPGRKLKLPHALIADQRAEYEEEGKRPKDVWIELSPHHKTEMKGR